MLDRTVAPPFRAVDDIHFQWPQSYQVNGTIPLFVLNAGTQPIITLELLLAAGTWYEPQPGIAYFTAKMLQKGTSQRNAQAIATYMDQYGAQIAVKVRPDFCSIYLTTLAKYLKPMLSLLATLLFESTFAAAPLALLKQLKAQAIKVEAEQHSQIARKKFTQALFGANHPYGTHLTPAVITAITPDPLKQYYKAQLLTGCTLLMSGKVTEKDIQAVQHYLQPLPTQQPLAMTHLGLSKAPVQLHQSLPQSLQAAIHIGKVWVTKTHPDYLPLYMVNFLLGGYFGSRLMRNLREDKGYTYGIFSRIVSLKHASYLCIATEVSHAFAQQTCHEIYQEIKALQTKLVPAEELRRLKSYLLGHFLATTQDPFSMMKRFKAAYLHGLDQAYYTQFYHTVRQLTASQVRTLANQYLAPDSFSQVIVG